MRLNDATHGDSLRLLSNASESGFPTAGNHQELEAALPNEALKESRLGNALAGSLAGGLIKGATIGIGRGVVEVLKGGLTGTAKAGAMNAYEQASSADKAGPADGAPGLVGDQRETADGYRAGENDGDTSGDKWQK